MIKLSDIMKDNLNIDCFKNNSIWKFTDDNEGHEPVLNHDSLLPLDQGVLFIKSNFITHDNIEFEGYIVGLETYYAFCLFYEGESYMFYITLPQYYERILSLLRKVLNLKSLNLFPLKFATEIKNSDGEYISGFFNE